MNNDQISEVQNESQLLVKIVPYTMSLSGKARADYMAHLIKKDRRMAYLTAVEMEKIRFSNLPNWETAKAGFSQNHQILSKGEGYYKGYAYLRTTQKAMLFNSKTQDAFLISLEEKTTEDMTLAEVRDIFSTPITFN